MKQELDELIRKLDQRKIVEWAPEMKLGRPAYDHIRGAVESGRPQNWRKGARSMTTPITPQAL